MNDVIVIGGGPAGSTAATLLARRGLSVLLLERDRFPRFQIGESLLPYNNDLFDRLGLSEKLQAGDFFPKYGAEFVTGDGTIGYTFRFDQNLAEQYHHARPRDARQCGHFCEGRHVYEFRDLELGAELAQNLLRPTSPTSRHPLSRGRDSICRRYRRAPVR